MDDEDDDRTPTPIAAAPGACTVAAAQSDAILSRSEVLAAGTPRRLDDALDAAAGEVGSRPEVLVVGTARRLDGAL
eukprot:2447355-Prymnesium_polylepis.1